MKKGVIEQLCFKKECEDCIGVFTDIICSSCPNNEQCTVNCEVLRSENKLFQLIDEQFGNKPLKFEELKEGMWVWDNCWCEWFEISEVYQETKEFDILIHQNAINKKRYETIKFEENRFYRKEVKDE